MSESIGVSLFVRMTFSCLVCFKMNQIMACSLRKHGKSTYIVVYFQNIIYYVYYNICCVICWQLTPLNRFGAKILALIPTPQSALSPTDRSATVPKVYLVFISSFKSNETAQIYTYLVLLQFTLPTLLKHFLVTLYNNRSLNIHPASNVSLFIHLFDNIRNLRQFALLLGKNRSLSKSLHIWQYCREGDCQDDYNVNFYF